jgi:hypothetical protein
MKFKAIFAALVLCLAAAAVCFADDAFTGTWKLNEAKSKMTAGMNKNTTVTYEASGDSVKITLDGVGADGKATHDEWTGKYDGKDYPVTGNSMTDTRAYKKVNDHTLEATGKKGRQSGSQCENHGFRGRENPHRGGHANRRRRKEIHRHRRLRKAVAAPGRSQQTVPGRRPGKGRPPRDSLLAAFSLWCARPPGERAAAVGVIKSETHHERRDPHSARNADAASTGRPA